MHPVPNQRLKNYLESNDLPVAREMLQVILDDNTLADDEVGKAFSWAASSNSNLLQPFDPAYGEPNPDRQTWSAEYYFDAKAKTSSNFCRERFEHLIAVRNHLRASQDPLFAYRPSQQADSFSTRPAGWQSAPADKKKILMSVILALAMLALAIAILQ